MRHRDVQLARRRRAPTPVNRLRQPKRNRARHAPRVRLTELEVSHESLHRLLNQTRRLRLSLRSHVAPTRLTQLVVPALMPALTFLTNPVAISHYAFLSKVTSRYDERIGGRMGKLRGFKPGPLKKEGPHYRHPPEGLPHSRS